MQSADPEHDRTLDEGDTLALMPKAARMDQLRRDYESMAPMPIGAPPPLDELLEELARLEARINRTA